MGFREGEDVAGVDPLWKGMRANIKWRPLAPLVNLLILPLLAGCGGSGAMPQPEVPLPLAPHHIMMGGGKGILLPTSPSLGDDHAHQEAHALSRAARHSSPRRDRLEDSDFVVKSIDSESEVPLAASGMYNEELLEEDSDEAWEMMLVRLLVGKDAVNNGKGQPNLPLGADSNGISAEVERWADEQRRKFKGGDLCQSRINRLASCGFNWHLAGKGWMAHFSSLCLHHQRHGSADVGVLQNGTRIQLGAWLSWQKSAWRRGKLPSDRASLLLSLGVRTMVVADAEMGRVEDERVEDSKWGKMYSELLQFRMSFGRVDNILHGDESGSSQAPKAKMTRNRKTDGPINPRENGHGATEKVGQLALWVVEHKEAYKHGRLAPRKQSLMESAGIVFDKNRIRWVERYRQLLEFKRESNGTWTGRVGKGKGGLASKKPRLSQWVKRQVRASQQGLLCSARRRLLERLGISYLGEPDGGDWNTMFAELRRYQHTCNDRSAGFGWTVSPKLGAWVHKQRILHRSGELGPKKERLLRGTGLSLTVGKRSWNGRLVELEAFKARYGHTNVPADFLGNRPLANWVHNVRTMRKRGTLSVEKEDCLEEMGFTWDLSKTAKNSWDGKARELMAFRMAHGHTSVPQCYEESPSLGRWVARMRHMNATGLLSKERAELLLGLGLGGPDEVERRGGKGIPRPGRRRRQEEEEGEEQSEKDEKGSSHKSVAPRIGRNRKRGKGRVDQDEIGRSEENLPSTGRRGKGATVKAEVRLECEKEAGQVATVMSDDGKAAGSAC